MDGGRVCEAISLVTPTRNVLPPTLSVISKLRINFNPLILTLLVVALVETVTRFKVQVLGRLRLLSKRRARARAASPTLPPPSLSQFAHAAVLVRSRGLHLRSESLRLGGELESARARSSGLGELILDRPSLPVWGGRRVRRH